MLLDLLISFVVHNVCIAGVYRSHMVQALVIMKKERIVCKATTASRSLRYIHCLPGALVAVVEEAT